MVAVSQVFFWQVVGAQRSRGEAERGERREERGGRREGRTHDGSRFIREGQRSNSFTRRGAGPNADGLWIPIG